METLVDYFRQWVKEDNFKWTDDMDLVDASPGHIECLFHTNKEHANFRGDLHGGVSITFADTLMGVCAATLGKSAATIDLNANYVKAGVAGSTLRGVVNVDHDGRKIIVMNARIYDEVGDVIPMARGTFYSLKPFELPDLPWVIMDGKHNQVK